MVHLAGAAGLDHQPAARAKPRAHQVVVHGGGGEQRRDRDALGRDLAIGEDDDVGRVVLAHRVLGVGAKLGEGRLHALRAPFGRVAHGQDLAAEMALGEGVRAAQLLHVLEGEDRLVDLQAHGRLGRPGREQVRARADEGHERHDELLADRVDRRVGHLREELAEVRVERLGPVRQHRERRVVAHGADGLLARDRHRRHQHLQVFLRVAEGLLAVEELVGVGRRDVVRRRDVLEADLGAVEPVLVRALAREVALQLVVGHDAAVLDVHQQHLARLQAPLPDDLLLRDVEHAHLRGHDDQVVVGDEVARGPQAVAVEGRADELAVGEGDRRRAVPRLHQRRVVLVEGAALGVHQRVAGPRLGDHQHHRVGDRVAAHHEQLQRVVERGRVGLALVDEGPDLVEVLAQQVRMDRGLARLDPVEVAAQRVDLAVVGDEAERVREVPRRERVGREALVREADGRGEALVGKIPEERADLLGEQHPLVDDRAVRERGDVEAFRVGQAERADGVARGLAHDVELALEGVAVEAAAPGAHEHLPHDRHGAPGGLAQGAVVHGHVAPAQQRLALVRDRPLDLAHAGRARGGLARQEDHPDPVGAGLGQLHLLPGHLLPEERVRDLHQQPRPVAVQGIGPGRPAMAQVVEDREPLLDDVVGLPALDVRDEAHAARVVLVAGVVESLFRRAAGFRIHAGHLWNAALEQWYPRRPAFGMTRGNSGFWRRPRSCRRESVGVCDPRGPTHPP